EWSVELGGLTMELRPTEAGQVGLFPEHASMLSWLLERVAARSPGTSVLHLFAYTGLATLALARSGAAVTHVDASKAAVAWARRNAAANGLADRPIRWLTEDVRAFVARERRRGRRYDGLVIDPPSYGHGTSGRAWRLETDLDGLIADCRTLLEPDGFVLLTAHTEGIGPDELAGRLRRAGRLPGSAVEAGPLEIEGEDGLRLRLGAFARWDGRTR
ncbi:MAG: class I SAM-dependent methyltransferase, partial [Candidatus Limnocylindrales bacterium]